jgi:predicted aspartyl protease
VLYSEIDIAMPYALTGEKKEWKTFMAVWDTGATNSVISNNVISQLSLVQTGKTEVCTAAGTVDKNTFIVDIKLPNKIFFKDLMVTDGELGNKFDVLVGMDIISSGDFSISNTFNKTIFTFCYPPLPKPHNIDLLKITNGLNKKVFTKTIKNIKKRNRRERRK